ncbi:MAG: radical SAM protein [Thermoanaerobaculia bacterium]
MLHQTALSLTPYATSSPPIFGEAPNGAPTCAARTHFYRTRARKAFRRSERGLLAGEKTRSVRVLEPYRGSEWPLVGTAGSLRGSRRILVRVGLDDAVRRELVSDASDSDPIEIGSAWDPYPSAEARFEATRAVLRALCETRGLELHLTTRSPLILRDLDLLRELDLGHSVTVRIPAATLDPRLSRVLEPGTAEPRARLEVVRCLAADGIATEVVCDPVLPGINSSADELDPLFAAARDAGAIDLVGDTRILRPAGRRRLLAWLRRRFPDRVDAVRRSLGTGSPDAVTGTLRRLRLAYGFPMLRSGRG